MCAQDHFSWADVLEERIDPRWSELKEQGNEALRAESLTTAINFYEAALSVTQQPLPQLEALPLPLLLKCTLGWAVGAALVYNNKLFILFYSDNINFFLCKYT